MNLLDHYRQGIAKYQYKGILLDTGPLLLLIVGSYDESQIEKFKYTQKYRKQDYHLLDEIVDSFAKTVTTPSILTEVCNWIGYFSDTVKEEIRSRFFCPVVKNMEEKYSLSSELGERTCFKKFGLTDSSIIESAKGSYLVLTDDLPLYGYLMKNKIDAMNFNHLRQFQLNAS